MIKNTPIEDMVADEKELKWFFDHCLFPLQPYEAYTMVLVSRHKKLTEQERIDTGMTKRQAEFLRTEMLRRPPFKQEGDEQTKNITFGRFLKTVRKLNFDVGAYLTPTGAPLPSKTLAVLMYVNPCDSMKVWDYVCDKVENSRTALIKAGINDKKTIDYAQNLQVFGNISDLVKHASALCKGSTYWLDFDVDVPDWWKCDTTNVYYRSMIFALNAHFGYGNYVVISTSGGYHVMVRITSVHSNPNDFAQYLINIYKQAVFEKHMPAYLDDKGNDKFECKLNNTSIPGVPLPGTYQYNRPVTVLNKEDYVNADKAAK